MSITEGINSQGTGTANGHAEQAAAASSAANGNGNGIVPSTSMTNLALLQGFLKAQQTRTSISHELSDAFHEHGITDEALNKVVHISSIGLLEIRTEVEEILVRLRQQQTQGVADADVQAAIRSIVRIEELEKDRIQAMVLQLQMERILKLREGPAGAGNENASAADSDSYNGPSLLDLRSAVQESERKTASLAEQINQVLQDVRETVVDLAASQEQESEVA